MTHADPRGFASDNRSGAHPEVLDAIARANEGHAASYGEDGWTARADELFREHFGAGAVGYPVFNGTAANVLAIDALTRPHEAVICAHGAHIDADECGAPERHAGVKLFTVEPEGGKIAPADLACWEARRGDQHHPQPRLVSVAQATEVGTVYSLDELGALAEAAHSLGMLLHVDGARLANAAASLGVSLAAVTAEAGVDAVSFGATKNGGLVGDAVVFLDADEVDGFEFVRKQGMQLASKMRFLSVQFEALLGEGELWRRNAEHANAMARRLGEGAAALGSVEVVHPVEANGVFARLPRPLIDRLLAELPGEDPFYIWDESANVVRWMCSWDTTEEDVDELLAALARGA
ncbi:MAG: low specificity L-threonine aldolase [Solirubrobacterales bacterium]|nr:low specificity L-threonine aldolase [Solirubrobacterales bacterium]